MACLFVVCAAACSGKVVHESASSQSAGGKGGASGTRGEAGTDAGAGAGGHHETTTSLDASGPSGVLTLASLQDLPSSIATDGKDVYWLNIGQIHRNGGKTPPDNTGGQIMTCSVRGCSGAPTVLVSGLSTDSSAPPMAVAGGNVYWADDTASGRAIEGCSASNCAATRSTLTTTASVYAMVADATDVYWVDAGGNVKACGVADCSTPRTFGGPIEAGGIAIDDDNVYWSNSPVSIVSCPKSGCGLSPVAVAILSYLGSTGIQTLVVAGDSLYFTATVVDSNGMDSKLFRCAKSGRSEPTVLASGLVNPSSLGTDGATLYFSERPDPCCTSPDESCCRGRSVSRISMCAATGCNGMPTVLVPGVSSASNIAADPHHVFWATRDDSGITGAVQMMFR